MDMHPFFEVEKRMFDSIRKDFNETTVERFLKMNNIHFWDIILNKVTFNCVLNSKRLWYRLTRVWQQPCKKKYCSGFSELIA